jgi:hypothetical protein
MYLNQPPERTWRLTPTSSEAIFKASTRVLVRPAGLDMVAVGGSTNAGGEIYRGSSAGKAEKRAVR